MKNVAHFAQVRECYDMHVHVASCIQKMVQELTRCNVCVRVGCLFPLQEVKSGKFEMYDYGSDNPSHYNGSVSLSSVVPRLIPVPFLYCK